MTETFMVPVRSSLRLIAKHYQFLIPAFLVSVGVVALISILKIFVGIRLFPLINLLIYSIIGTTIFIGWANVVLKLIRTSSMQWKDFFVDFRSWRTFFIELFIFVLGFAFIGSLIFILILAIAFTESSSLFLIIPALLGILGILSVSWVITRLLVRSYNIIDKHSSIGSSTLFKGNLFKILCLWLCLILINAVASMLFSGNLNAFNFIAILIKIITIIIIPLIMITTGFIYESSNK